MDLVTLEQTKLRLRMDGEALDSDIELAISGASTLVLRHLGKAADEFLLDGGGDPLPEADVVVPGDVQNAALLLIGVMLRDPDGKESKEWDAGYLPRPVTSLLASRRVPPLA